MVHEAPRLSTMLASNLAVAATVIVGLEGQADTLRVRRLPIRNSGYSAAAKRDWLPEIRHKRVLCCHGRRSD